MLYELRTYTTPSPEALARLQRRFTEKALALFRRHGIEAVGFWIAEDDPLVLVYLLRFRDKAQSTAAWDSFRADPDWARAKAESERELGPLVARIESRFLSPTAYSPLLS